MVFVKGQSGNPGGRPKREWTWGGLIAEAMEEMLTTKDGSKGKAKDFVVKRLIRMAIDGDIQAQKEIMNRMDGMPKQTTDLTTDGQPLQQIIYAGNGFIPPGTKISSISNNEGTSLEK